MPDWIWYLLYTVFCCLSPMAVFCLGIGAIVYFATRKPKAVLPPEPIQVVQKEKEIKMNKILGIGGDANWTVTLKGLDLEAETVEQVLVDRRDGKFFMMAFTKVMGYLFPMFWETLDASGKAGAILLKVRKNTDGVAHLVLEKCKWVDENNNVAEGWRVPRTSVNNPDGQPLLEVQGVPLEHFTSVLTNNARIAGPVACAAMIQKWDDPLNPEKEKLVTLMEAADMNDAPGLAVLAKWLVKHPQH